MNIKLTLGKLFHRTCRRISPWVLVHLRQNHGSGVGGRGGGGLVGGDGGSVGVSVCGGGGEGGGRSGTDCCSQDSLSKVKGQAWT